MKYLLDTCVLSEFVKPIPSSIVLAWVDTQAETDLLIAAMTLAELRRGVAKLAASNRKNELAIWVEKLQVGFEDRILPFTKETAAYWGEICAHADAAGKTMAAFDSIIAATAVEHGLILATRNTKDFSAAPLITINPWQAG